MNIVSSQMGLSPLLWGQPFMAEAHDFLAIRAFTCSSLVFLHELAPYWRHNFCLCHHHPLDFPGKENLPLPSCCLHETIQLPNNRNQSKWTENRQALTLTYSTCILKLETLVGCGMERTLVKVVVSMGGGKTRWLSRCLEFYIRKRDHWQ